MEEGVKALLTVAFQPIFKLDWYDRAWARAERFGGK